MLSSGNKKNMKVVGTCIPGLRHNTHKLGPGVGHYYEIASHARTGVVSILWNDVTL